MSPEIYKPTRCLITLKFSSTAHNLLKIDLTIGLQSKCQILLGWAKKISTLCIGYIVVILPAISCCMGALLCVYVQLCSFCLDSTPGTSLDSNPTPTLIFQTHSQLRCTNPKQRNASNSKSIVTINNAH